MNRGISTNCIFNHFTKTVSKIVQKVILFYYNHNVDN